MRITLPILVGLLVVGTVSAFAASNGGETLPYDKALMRGDLTNDTPIGATYRVDPETTWFGRYEVIDGEYHALSFNNKPQGSWTFDLGTGPVGDPPRIDNGEGWSAVDLTANLDEYFRVIDSSLDLGLNVPPPIINGAYSLWVGADQDQSDALCWGCGPGYGNDWCQRVTSPVFAYNGTGDITLNMLYWSQTEPCYDGTQIYLLRSDNTELMLNPYPSGECTNNVAYTGGTFTDSIGHYSTPETYNRVISAAEIGGAQNVHIIFEFSADGGWSDEDCLHTTIWSGFGTDDVTVSGPGIDDAFYNFEDGTLQGWTTSVCDPIGIYTDIVDVGCYTILDPCACRLENNILEMHSGLCDEGVHPVGQNIWIESPICDIGDGSTLQTIFMEFDMYAELPLENGVLIRPGWRYYPAVCEATGAVGWSVRVGQSAYNYFGTDPVCGTWRYSATSVAGVPVPADAEKVIAIIELLGSCEAFTITDCSGITNFTPLFDNIAVGVTQGVNAPIINFEIGMTFQDVGSYPSALFDPRAPGPANVTRDKFMDTPPGTAKDKCGDSLVVRGPMPGTDPNTRWEARFWWRVAKRAPFQADLENGATSRYKVWKDRVADGKLIDRPDRPQFAFGWMDSNQIGFVVNRDKFISAFRENDDDFVGEGNPENEILWDDIFYPGTRIEYFCTANFVGQSDLYYLPDTTGSFFSEFEVLPGIRSANVPNCGGTGFNYCVFQPATLFIDAFNRGSQFYIENALRTVLNGLDACIDEDGCVIPENRNWDRYDYLDPSSNWNAPFVRGSVAGSNNGMTLNQILGYRAFLVNFGSLGAGSIQDEDYGLFDQWLIAPDCDANLNRQVFLLNGDKAGEAAAAPGGQGIEGLGLAFLNNTLGATVWCEAFNGVSENPNCAPVNTSFCLRWMPVGGGPFSTETDVDAWGSYCPNLYGFNIYGLNGGTGNRFFSAEDGLKDATYAQVTNQNLGAAANYRTVLDGVSWHHLTARVPPGGDTTGVWCPRDVPSVVDGSLTEIGAALKWGFGVGNYASVPKLASAEELADCQGTWGLPADVDGGSPALLVNRLYQNQPNPFNPKTTIQFSLAQSGPVEIAIYDVNGRLVKTLVDGRMDAGPHSVVWDGTNDEDRHVGSGVYWSQMKVSSYISNKKMVILK